jgi:uncharacterized protein YaaW (UPF0174 family)
MIMTTQLEARFWAETAVEILFSAGDPFKGQVNKDSLVTEIEAATLLKLVTEDIPDLSEEEFQECIKNAKTQA